MTHATRRYERTARVNEVVREVLADELERLSDPRLGFVTVTGVEVTPDLRQATVYYSALAPTPGNPDAEAEAAKETALALRSVTPHLQAAIAVAVVAESNHHLTEVLDTVERFVRSAPDVEVLDTTAAYLEPED